MKKDEKKSKNLEKAIWMSAVNDMTMLLQAILAFFILTFSIMSFFVSEVLLVVESLMAIFFFLLAYNNYKIYKRKGITVVYILVGLFILATVFAVVLG